MFWIYILLSIKDKNFYVGQTKNLERRMKEHNLGLVKSTKNSSPLCLVYCEIFENRWEAMKRDFF
ncbi:MAG: GIY-YIG nuclease family protein [Candidatus Paceibacteria bacterium]